MRVKKRERAVYRNLRKVMPLIYEIYEGTVVVPTAVEKKLREEAERKFPGDTDRQNAYIFGTLRKNGWKPKQK